MNTGLQDAHYLALLLADIVQGPAMRVGSTVTNASAARCGRLVEVTDRAFGISAAAALLPRSSETAAAAGTPIMPRIPSGRRPTGGYLASTASVTTP